VILITKADFLRKVFLYDSNRLMDFPHLNKISITKI